MQNVLTSLEETLSQSHALVKEALLNQLASNLVTVGIKWKVNYPVAIKHDGLHTQQDFDLQALETYSGDHLDTVRSIDLVALTKDVSQLTFAAKRPKDFWKRLQSVEHIKAMIAILCTTSDACSDTAIENSLKTSNKGQWELETELRDAMRANKENRDLGVKPFIMVMAKPYVQEPTDHVEKMLQHYFSDHVRVIRSEDSKVNYYLAYHEHMGEIGMRYFYKFAA